MIAKPNKRPRKSFHAKIGRRRRRCFARCRHACVDAQRQENTVVLNEKDLSLKIQSGSTIWSMVPSASTDMLLKSGDDEFAVRLADAGRIDIVPDDAAFKTGVKITLDHWKGKSGPRQLAAVSRGPPGSRQRRSIVRHCRRRKSGQTPPARLAGRYGWARSRFTVFCNGRGTLLARFIPRGTTRFASRKPNPRKCRATSSKTDQCHGGVLKKADRR